MSLRTSILSSMLTKRGFGYSPTLTQATSAANPYILIQIPYQFAMLPLWFSTVASIGMAVGPPLVCTGRYSSTVEIK